MALSGWSASNFVRVPSGIITAAPVTMACWAKTSDVTTNQQLMGLYNSASNDLNKFEMDINSGNVRALTSDGTSGNNATKSGLTTNTWFHAGAVFGSATSRVAWLNGAKGTADTTSRTPSGINRAVIGIQNNASATIKPFLGQIAEAAWWNVALDDAEMASLAAGFPPMLIRPQSLIAYLPLVRDLIDLKGNAFAIQGSLTVADHCRIYGRGA